MPGRLCCLMVGMDANPSEVKTQASLEELALRYRQGLAAAAWSGNTLNPSRTRLEHRSRSCFGLNMLLLRVRVRVFLAFGAGPLDVQGRPLQFLLAVRAGTLNAATMDAGEPWHFSNSAVGHAHYCIGYAIGFALENISGLVDGQLGL